MIDMARGLEVPISLTIGSVLESLNPAQRRVADFVLKNPNEAAELTIVELAKKCDTSEASVTRLCHSLGLRGYSQFRLALATDAGKQMQGGDADLGGDIGPNDDLSIVVKKVAGADARAVSDTAELLSLSSLKAAVVAISEAKKIDIYGVGASGFVAVDLQLKLHRIGKIAFALIDPHLALTSAALLNCNDVALGISHSGATIDTIDALTEAKKHGATTIALTNSVNSPLAQIADIVLTTAARETTFRSGATASRLAQLALVDCLFVAVAQQDYSESLKAIEQTSAAVRSRRRK